jgi:ATP-binding cassette subfamily B protein
MQIAARELGLEAEPVQVSYREIDRFLLKAGPLVVVLPADQGRALCVLGGRRGILRILTPNATELRVPVAEVGRLLRAPLEAPIEAACARVAESTVGPSQAGRVRDALVRQILLGAEASGCWILRPGPALGVGQRLRQQGAVRRLSAFLLCHLAFVLLWLGSWLVLGRAILQDRLGVGVLAAWALLLATLIPLRLMRTALSGQFAIETGTVLKQALLTGAARLDPASMRHLGVGQLLGRVLEAEAMETLTLASGLISVTAVLELILAGAVLGSGVGGLAHTLLLALCVSGMGILALRYHTALKTWSNVRLELTHEAVENLVGHKTRLVQHAPDAWHERIDELQTSYVRICETVDRLAVSLNVVPRAWLLVGLLPIIPPFVAGQASAAGLATAFGGLLLAYRAFRELAIGLDHAGVAAVAWQRLGPLVTQSSPDELAASNELEPAAAPCSDRGRRSGPLLESSEITYRHPLRDEAAVQSVSVQVRPADRILLEGVSGSGKSTLGSLLSGNAMPTSGVLLLGGLDLRTVGSDHWRRRVVLVPQFHDNRLFMGSLAFNLLMGREWPPSPEVLGEAEQICRALGLGGMLDRMPGGMSQAVGETGWHLSHGERSRVFIARAVLQRPEIMILDESLAALDTQNLSRVLGFLRELPSAMIVIAHP